MLQTLFICAIVVTCVSIYFPTIFIRKMNKFQKILEQIEANTRKP